MGQSARRHERKERNPETLCSCVNEATPTDTTSTTSPATTSSVSCCNEALWACDPVSSRLGPGRNSLSPPRRLLAPHEPAPLDRHRLSHRSESLMSLVPLVPLVLDRPLLSLRPKLTASDRTGLHRDQPIHPGTGPVWLDDDRTEAPVHGPVYRRDPDPVDLGADRVVLLARRQFVRLDPLARRPRRTGRRERVRYRAGGLRVPWSLKGLGLYSFCIGSQCLLSPDLDARGSLLNRSQCLPFYSLFVGSFKVSLFIYGSLPRILPRQVDRPGDVDDPRQRDAVLQRDVKEHGALDERPDLHGSCTGRSARRFADIGHAHARTL